MNAKKTLSLQVVLLLWIQSVYSAQTVNGSLTIDDASYPGVYFKNGSTNFGTIRVDVSQDLLSIGDMYGAYPALGLRFYANDVERMRITSSGDVGIGTASPSAKLEVAGDVTLKSSGHAYLRISGAAGDSEVLWQENGANRWALGMNVGEGTQNFNLYNYTTGSISFSVNKASGNVGIGTANPTAKLEVVGDIRAYRDGSDSIKSQLYFANEANNRAWNWQLTANGESAYWGFNGSTWAEMLRVNFAGNVGIGTTNPSHKLSVNGSIRAKEVIVETGWADHVFEEGYSMRSLKDVESHIEEHGHLPDVPSAATVESQGLSVGEAQKIMMQKIEELTLYMIEKDNQISALQQRVAELESN